ncbi:LuxR C-terminal-related transcriptional regulator [Evansella cellulosilytica]|uniref:Transcriptional regulator, LuxR family n=1 Tax=Evansella cellulosilytica (strain ATCC 21833 / DSM 2522 / FERM P-1141 / JCM 9156 / N-4) TaxID=649639 RepID=E6U2A6_EVAC2|nr:LuxR C-terminal-related transcriptional regulator [Evansella cellulosilytica]ADU30484.1 transcriptional regulator, LuxR family [Evansella cellulosilytica DSM 2522]
MNQMFKFNQHVQDAFSALTGLNIVIVDSTGNELTTVSGNCSFTELVYEKYGHKSYFAQFLQPLLAIKHTVLVDSPLGGKVIVSPIIPSGGNRYFIIAGYIVDAFTKKYLYTRVSQFFSETEQLTLALNNVTILDQQEIQYKFKQINEFSKIVTYKSRVLFEKKQGEEHLKLVNESLDCIIQGTVTVSSFIKSLQVSNMNIDIIGAAIETENDLFSVVSTTGKDGDKLYGHTFQIGEGFLGQALATNKPQFWRDISTDPRVNLFTRNGIEVQSLICTPFYVNNKVYGVLFGLSSDKMLYEHDIENFKIYATLLSTLSTMETLKEDQHNHLMKLSTFNEIFKVITSVEDIKRVLYILVDISINIVRGPFSCILFINEEDHNKVDIVSRGMSQIEINDYCQHVATRFLSAEALKKLNFNYTSSTTSWGTEVLEFPLFFNQKLYGVLCVGISDQTKSDSYRSFLASLAVAGGISIHLRLNNKSHMPDNKAITMLYYSLQHTNLEQFHLNEKVRKILLEYLVYTNRPLDDAMDKASQLISYRPEFLKEYISDQNILSILEGYWEAVERKVALNEKSDILALISHYVLHNENIESIRNLTHISESKRSSFIQFISQVNITESEIMISSENKSPINMEERSPKSKITEDLKLSKRELDVLDLVLKGYSNSDIANTLFISDHTVKNHMTKILQKLDCTDRSQAIAKVYQMGYSPNS